MEYILDTERIIDYIKSKSDLNELTIREVLDLENEFMINEGIAELIQS
nr:MAG TPA: hypothetical protein [Caudoviricetes sp.]